MYQRLCKWPNHGATMAVSKVLPAGPTSPAVSALHSCYDALPLWVWLAVALWLRAHRCPMERSASLDLTKFYRDHGSLTTPRCEEAVVWTRFEEPIKMGRDLVQPFPKTLK